MVEITIEEIAQDPLTYLHRTQIGESFIVLQAGKPIAQINPVQSQPQMTLANAIAILQDKIHTDALEINPDEIWNDIRDRTPAPDQPRW